MTTRPGDIISTWEDGGDHGIGLVVATSRHKRRLDRTEADERLAAEAALALVGRDRDPGPLRKVLANRKTWTWRSVTRSEIERDDHGCFTECDEGAWCSEGQGSAWVEVLGVTHSEVYDLLDNPERDQARAGSHTQGH